MTVTLDDRLTALAAIRAVGEERIGQAASAEIDALLARAGQRRQRSPGYTVVGIFGATGSGKSSLVNALVGDQVARTHVRRPTTSQPLAVTWEPEGAADLLDWLQVSERVVRDAPLDARARRLILLDLPDFDSVERANREIAQRLAAQVDALVWVVDPQKYADEVLHAQFIAPHARHAEVTLVVLNQVDLLPRAEVPRVVDSLREIVARDGIPRARVIPTSAVTGEGIQALRDAVGELAAARNIRDSRLAADAATLAASLTDPGRVGSIESRAAARLRDEVGTAAGVELVAGAVARSYRKRAGQATGWPLVSWLGRLRADPLTRLGLGASRSGSDPALHRTSMQTPDAAAQARLSRAVRTFADTAAEGLNENWRGGVRRAAERSLTRLPDALDLAIARTPLPARGSWWWVIVGLVQWIALAAGLVGVGWLLAAALLPTFGLPALEVPRYEGWAVPTLLIIAAVLLGILLGLVAGALSAVTAASRRRRTRRLLLAGVGEVVNRDVVAPVTAELEAAARYTSALATARA